MGPSYSFCIFTLSPKTAFHLCLAYLLAKPRFQSVLDEMTYSTLMCCSFKLSFVPRFIVPKDEFMHLNRKSGDGGEIINITITIIPSSSSHHH